MKTVFAAFVAMTIGLTSFAQGQGPHGQQGPQGTPEEQAQKMTDRMKTELSLTDAQVKQVYEINLNTVQKREEVRKGNQELRESMREEHMAALAKVLTPDQQEKAKQLRAERKGNMKQKHRNCK